METKKVMKAYVDGSYTTKRPGVSGWGALLMHHDGRIEEIYGEVPDLEQRQVTGEIEAMTQAVAQAIGDYYDKITVFYDYEGLNAWTTGAWKAKNARTKEYVEFMAMAKTRLEINLVKIEGADNKADALARKVSGVASAH